MVSQELIDDVGDLGERIVGSHHDYVYYSHLSVYRFALSFLQGKSVLDLSLIHI